MTSKVESVPETEPEVAKPASKPKPATKNILFDPAALKGNSLFAKIAKNNPLKEPEEKVDEDSWDNEDEAGEEEKPKVVVDVKKPTAATAAPPLFTPPLVAPGESSTPPPAVKKGPISVTPSKSTISTTSDSAIFDETKPPTLSAKSSEMLSAQKVND